VSVFSSFSWGEAECKSAVTLIIFIIYICTGNQTIQPLTLQITVSSLGMHSPWRQHIVHHAEIIPVSIFPSLDQTNKLLLAIILFCAKLSPPDGLITGDTTFICVIYVPLFGSGSTYIFSMYFMSLTLCGNSTSEKVETLMRVPFFFAKNYHIITMVWHYFDVVYHL
jgi:hypothetical protein